MDRALFISELHALINETRRKYPEVRHAAEVALEALKRGGAGGDAGVLMRPIERGCATRNGKVVGICVGALQRLVGMDAVDSTAVPAILLTLDSVLTHGVDIQLKVLQTILSVLTYCTDVHGEVLGDALLLCFKLHDVKHPVVNSTAAATLRQAVMLVFERVAEEDATISRIAPTNNSTADQEQGREGEEEPPLTQVNADNLPPVLQDAYTLLSDLCILARPPSAGRGKEVVADEEEEPWLLRSLSSSGSGGVTRTFALELVESVVAGFRECIKAHRELVFLLQYSLTPFLRRTLTEKSSSFQLTLRTMRLVFLLTQLYLDQIPAEDEGAAMLAFLVRVVAGDAEVLALVPVERASGSCAWFRALALEVVKGLCHDPSFLLNLWQRYDGVPSRSNIVTNLVFTLNRVITERPHLLGVNSTIGGLGIASGSSSDAFGTAFPHTAGPVQSSLSTTSGARYSASGYLDMGLSAVATAASVGVNTVNAMMGNEDDGKLDASCAIKTQCLDQYDKSDPPAVPERYIYLLALQILEEVASSFAVVSESDVATPRQIAIPNREEHVVDLSTNDSPTTSPTVADIQKAMMDAAWPALLAALTFLMGVNLSEDLFQQLLTAFRVLILASDSVSHFTARNTFLSSLARYAVPAAVVKAMQAYSESGGGGGGASSTRNSSVLSVDALGLGSMGIASSSNQPPSLSEHNLACLRVLLDVIRGCSSTLNESWHDVLETLQNANYVLGKKAASGVRKASNAMNGTPLMPPSPSRSRMASLQMERVSSTMTEGEVDAIQLDIRDLFESSGRFDDATFQHFTDALCRLSADMIGVDSTHHGSTSGPSGTTPPILDSSLPSSPRATPRDLHLHIPTTSTRRRASGLHKSQATRPGEKSFAIAMLDNVASNNMARLLGSDPDLAWNNIVNHLLEVAFCSTAPAVIRNQAAAVLNNILVAAANAISESEEVSFQQRIGQQLFQALSREIQPVISGAVASIDIDIKVAGLHTLLVVLESCGHALSDVWSTVFNILGSVFSNSVQNTDGESLKSRRRSDLPSLHFQTVSHKSQVQMLRTAFPSVNLICSDFVMTFDASALGCAIDTLERYGRQSLDVNITLAAIGLIWNVSDTVRSSAVDLETPQRETLWLKLLHCLLVLSSDRRNEVRTSALQTLFKCLELHGGKLPESTWTLVLDGVLFPLLHDIKKGPIELDEDEREETETIPFTTYDATAQWADTASLALNSFANILDGFGGKLTEMDSFDATLEQLASISVDFFGRAGDKSCTATLTMFRKLISVVRDRRQSPDVLWRTIEGIRNTLVANAQLDRTANETTYSQNSLSLLIQVAQDMAISFPTADYHHQEMLLNIVKEAVTYSRSPTYASDVDAMTPVQKSAIDFVRAGCGEAYSPFTSNILCDLAEYITLAFIGAFEYMDQSLPYANNKKQVAKQVTFIALSKAAMPLAALIFAKFSREKAVYESGAFERVLGALALPIKLKYECPASNKYGDDAPLWQTATDSAISMLKDTPRNVSSLAKDLSQDQHESLWQQIVEVIRATLLADCSSLSDMPPAEREKEESLDWPFLQMLETHLLPVLGYPEMSDQTLQALAEIVHSATQLWRGVTSSEAGTEEIETLPRERFHYWCFDLLFIVTSRTSVVDDVQSARRTAGFFLPLLVSRCKASLMGYLDELSLRGAIPFERIREEELVYILQRLLDLQVWEDGLRAVMTADGTHAISPLKQAILQSPRAHLFHLYPILLEIVTYNGTGQLPTVWVAKQSGPTRAKLDQPPGEPVDRDSGRVDRRAPTTVDAGDAVEVNAREVAKACLKMLSKDMGV